MQKERSRNNLLVGRHVKLNKDTQQLYLGKKQYSWHIPKRLRHPAYLIDVGNIVLVHSGNLNNGYKIVHVDQVGRQDDPIAKKSLKSVYSVFRDSKGTCHFYPKVSHKRILSLLQQGTPIEDSCVTHT